MDLDKFNIDLFFGLPFKLRYKLLSTGFSQKIQVIGQKYGIELLKLAGVTRLIREYYFGEARLEDFPREIAGRTGVNPATAQEIANFIRSEIIDWDPWAEYIAGLPKLSIREILAKYPSIGEQEISNGYIELPGRDDLSDGTINNWLRDYVLHLGQERHSPIERMNYLFHTENTKGLASPEREKIGIILKSFDENTPLPVDGENNEIIFDEAEKDVGSAGFRPENIERPVSVAEAWKVSLHPEFASANLAKPIQEKIPDKRTSPQPILEKKILPKISPIKTPVTAPKKTSFVTPKLPQKPAENSQSDFIKPYKPQSEVPSKLAPQKPATSLQKKEILSKAPYTFKFSASKTSPKPAPTVMEKPKEAPTDKFFENASDQAFPPVKIRGFTEHVVPKMPNQPKIPPHAGSEKPPEAKESTRPRHRIVNPFQGPLPEPKLNGNVVDLREQ